VSILNPNKPTDPTMTAVVAGDAPVADPMAPAADDTTGTVASVPPMSTTPAGPGTTPKDVDVTGGQSTSPTVPSMSEPAVVADDTNLPAEPVVGTVSEEPKDGGGTSGPTTTGM